jgi:hypothetical protein
MNSQIQRLLDKSTDDILGVKVVNQEKFARLLIEECVTVIDGMRFTDEGPSEGASYQRTLCGTTIKEYFELQSKGPISSRNIP